MEPTPAAPLPEEPQPSKARRFHGKRLPSAIVAGGAAFAMTLAGLGIANAQTDDATPPTTESAPADGDGVRRHRHTHADHHPHARLSVAAEAIGITTLELRNQLVAGKSIAQVAEANDIAPQAVIDALVADATGVLNTAVENGRITREQADARIAELPERMADFVNRVHPFDGREGGRKGPGPGMKLNLDAASTALGMTPAELRTELQAGKSLATVAGEQGVDVDAVIAALVTEAKARLAQAVTDGKLTKAQADEKAADLEARITDLVNRTPPADGERRRGPGPGHGPGHAMKANLDAAATALGLTTEELRTELRAGKSLATIAGEQGVEVGKVVSALVADAKARLAQAVTDGTLTQAEADEKAADLEARITDLVNRVGRAHDGRHPGPGAMAPASDPDGEPAALEA